MGHPGLQASGCHLTRNDQRRETPGQEPNLVPNPPWEVRTSDHFRVLPHPPTQASPLPKPDGPCLVLWRDAHFPVHVGEYCWCRGRTTRPVTLPLGPRNTSLTQADFPNFQEPTVL